MNLFCCAYHTDHRAECGCGHTWTLSANEKLAGRGRCPDCGEVWRARERIDHTHTEGLREALRSAVRDAEVRAFFAFDAVSVV